MPKDVGACAQFASARRGDAWLVNAVPPRNVTVFNPFSRVITGAFAFTFKAFSWRAYRDRCTGGWNSCRACSETRLQWQPEQKWSSGVHWFSIYSDTFANKALNITWNQPNLIRTTAALPCGQHYQLFLPELRGWIWHLSPCVSIWPIPSSAPRTELAQVTWPRDRAHKRTGSRQNKSKHLWISTASPSEWTYSRNSFIMLLMFCFTLSCFFLSLLEGDGRGGWGVGGRVGALGFGTYVLLLGPAEWICHTAVSMLHSETKYFRLKNPILSSRDIQAWIQASTVQLKSGYMMGITNRLELSICFLRCIIDTCIGEYTVSSIYKASSLQWQPCHQQP